MSFCSAFIFYNSDVFVSSDKYVTRSEWDELARSHRILEERCYRVEALLLQFHPELAVPSNGASPLYTLGWLVVAMTTTTLPW